MALITDKTQIKLISKLSGTSAFNGSDLLLLQRGFKSYKFNYSDLVSALPDGSTLEASSNQLGVKDSGIDTPQLADNSVNFSKMQDIGNNKLIGRTASGSGDPSEIEVITNLATAKNSNIPTGSAVTGYVDNKVPSDVNLSENGYAYLPNGLIMQWGTLTPSSIVTLVTLPTPFPTQCLNVTASLGEIFSDSDYEDNSLIIGGYPGNNATEIYILCNLHNGNNHFYKKIFLQAIGY